MKDQLENISGKLNSRTAGLAWFTRSFDVQKNKIRSWQFFDISVSDNWSKQQKYRYILFSKGNSEITSRNITENKLGTRISFILICGK